MTAHGMLNAGKFYEVANHGLAYWVDEPQIVCEMYEAWIPHVRVRWEARRGCLDELLKDQAGLLRFKAVFGHRLRDFAGTDG